MMKLLFISIIILCYSNFSLSQKRVYTSEDGLEIGKSMFYSKWKNQTRWDSISLDNTRYIKLNGNRILKGLSDYPKIKRELEEIAEYKIPNNSIIVINFHFKNDLCNNTVKNKWHRIKINSVKRNLKPYLKKLKSKNAFYISLFENGMIINTKKNLENEYFFIDKNNFFRKNLFLKNSFCGSSAALKPNGELLIYNGEGSISIITKNLETDKWNQFFKKN